MERVFIAVVSAILIMPALLLAKGPTAKITVQSSDLPATIEITDPNVRQFVVWDGPGTFMNGVEAQEGFIIDWRNGIVAAPVGLHQYKVSFYITCQGYACHTTEPLLTYVVLYAYDPSGQQGFVYLPGGHDEFAQQNMSAILHGHGYEGHWFRATTVWDDFVGPFITR